MKKLSWLAALPLLAQVPDGAKYSPLDQINLSNVGRLTEAWTFHSGDMYAGSKGGLRGKASAFETTPLFADGTLFITTAFGRVIALEPETGRQKWAYDPKINRSAGYGDFVNRGVSSWVDATSKKRTLFIATIDARLIALDAATGLPLPAFGNEGRIDLKKGLRLPAKGESEYEETSPPAVIGNMVVVGSGIADNVRTDMPSGEVRAYDVRSGKLAWTFDPMPGTRTGAANAWSLITPDPENGLVFVPTGSPSPDYYGGERKGSNQYANSIVALNAKTGAVVWSFQTVRHDLWDYDVASQPALITVKGRPAVAVGSKTGNLFILDRMTGKPVFGVEERRVPKSDVAGEESSPTQPFPLLPARPDADRIEAWGPTADEKKWCEAEFSRLRYDGLFTPPSLKGSLLYPGNIGGEAWGGVAFDPKSATLIYPYNRLAAVAMLTPRADLPAAAKEHPDWEIGSQLGTPYAMLRTFLLGPKGSPCNPPPFGLLMAIDANTGAQKWKVPMGYIPWMGDHPEWGSPALGGPVVTAGGLVLMGATFDPYLKAYDEATGNVVWRGKLPTSARATPMTFMGSDGRQYVVIAAGGHDVPGITLSDALVAFALQAPAKTASPVAIRVDASQSEGRFRPIFRYFGYDEPNYTYAENGRKLVGELAALSDPPVYLRAHHLLTTGDGVAAFKWGSTNAYTEDANGKPIYDWKIVDRILDTWVQSGARPFVEIGFMPKALSTHPDPYVPVWSPGDNFDRYYVGWAYPPNDYEKWSALVYELVRHAVARYGQASVEQWYWEVWNEPDIAYWHGTPEEYDKLYDVTAAAVKRALPAANVGGPASTGPSGAKAGAFLRQFLEHCQKVGSPLDFISFHAKGRPSVVDGHVRMGVAKNLQDADAGFQIVASFPKFKGLPIVLSESDPEGCAACSARVYPQNAYRNGPLYASYTAVAMKGLTDLAKRDGVNLEGMLTWAFEFEGQPYFDGFRTLATNGVDKPVLNFFRMAGMLTGGRVKVESSGAVDEESIVKTGVPEKPDVDAIAVRSEHSVRVLIWNYQDNDVAGAAADVDLQVAGLPLDLTRVSLRHFRIDEMHSNAYTVWKAGGSPAAMEAAGQLQMLGSPVWIGAVKGAVATRFDLPLQGLSLVEMSW